MKQRDDKCPSYKVKLPYQCFIAILFGDDEMEVRRDSHSEKEKGVGRNKLWTRGWGYFNDNIK